MRGMKKAEFIERYGEEAYELKLKQSRVRHKAHREGEKAHARKWRAEHPEEKKASDKSYRAEHPEEIKADSQKACRKGGKRYERNLKYKQTGLQGEKNKIRNNHANQYRQYKALIAPNSQIHHEWIPRTAEYRGVALVEKDPHQYGIIDVILILDGEITLLTEEEVRRGQKVET